MVIFVVFIVFFDEDMIVYQIRVKAKVFDVKQVLFLIYFKVVYVVFKIRFPFDKYYEQ